MKEAVDIEIDFICNAIPCRLIGMNADTMTEYIKFVADRLCVQLGYDKLYGSSNPFAFMELISMEKRRIFSNIVSVNMHWPTKRSMTKYLISIVASNPLPPNGYP